jgi:hypothetical protein
VRILFLFPDKNDAILAKESANPGETPSQFKSGVSSYLCKPTWLMVLTDYKGHFQFGMAALLLDSWNAGVERRQN